MLASSNVDNGVFNSLATYFQASLLAAKSWVLHHRKLVQKGVKYLAEEHT